ncbi:MAG: ABC transporter ATP-binding protein [Acidimicrobiales bacterium]
MSKRTETSGWSLLWRALRQEWRGLLIGFAIALVWTVGKTAVPRLVQLGIDRGIEGGESLLKWSTLVLVAGTFAAVGTGVRRYTAFYTARQVERRLRDRIFAHLQRLHFAFHDRVQTGDLMSRANTDLQQIQNLVVMLPVTMGNALVVLVSAVIMLSTNFTLGLVALVGLPFVTILGQTFSRKLHPIVMSVQRESADVASVVEETVAGIRVVKGFGAEERQHERLATEADELLGYTLEAARIRSNLLPAIELAPRIGLVAVLLYGGHLVVNGSLTIGELVSINIYVLMLIQPLRMLGMVIAWSQRAAVAAIRIDEILSTAPEVTSPSHPVAAPKLDQAGAVRFEDVSFSYEDGTSVLSNFNLDIAAGSSVAIVGATGSGKSTVAQLLPRFYEIDSGRITLDGVPVNELDLQELRRAIGIVFEETFLFDASVRDNIAFAQPDASNESVVRAARLAGADEFIAEMRNGYNTIIGERGFALSGGQRQRVAIARAILAERKVLILDDATSAVDPSKEREIRDALADAGRNRTMIVIAHRPATISLADTVALVDDGRVVATGTHDELLQSSERYREVLAAAEETV